MDSRYYECKYCNFICHCCGSKYLADIDCSTCKDHAKFVLALHMRHCPITGKRIKESLKQDMIDFFEKNPDKFGAFCKHLLEGEPVMWDNKIVSSEITAEVYQAMREKFPGRKDG